MTKIEPRAFPDCFAANAKKQKKQQKDIYSQCSYINKVILLLG